MNRFLRTPAEQGALIIILVSLLFGGLGVLGWQLANRTTSAESSERRLPPEPNFAPDTSVNAVPNSGKHSRMHSLIQESLRTAIDNIPSDSKIWIDGDTVVYLLPRDPHDFSGEMVAVAHHLPTGAVKNYMTPGEDPFVEYVGHHPDARKAADQMQTDPRIAAAVSILLGGDQ